MQLGNNLFLKYPEVKQSLYQGTYPWLQHHMQLWILSGFHSAGEVPTFLPVSGASPCNHSPGSLGLQPLCDHPDQLGCLAGQLPQSGDGPSCSLLSCHHVMWTRNQGPPCREWHPIVESEHLLRKGLERNFVCHWHWYFHVYAIWLL